MRWAYTWLDTYKSDIRTDGDKDYKSRIDKIILPEIGSLRLVDVKETHLQEILNSRRDKNASDIAKTHNTICAMLRRARLSRIILFDPSESLKRPAGTSATHRSITDDERKCTL